MAGKARVVFQERLCLCNEPIVLATLVQEGRSKEAEGRRKESFYRKFLKLF
jgi:hypothetical protein